MATVTPGSSSFLVSSHSSTPFMYYNTNYNNNNNNNNYGRKRGNEMSKRDNNASKRNKPSSSLVKEENTDYWSHDSNYAYAVVDTNTFINSLDKIYNLKFYDNLQVVVPLIGTY